MQKMLYLEIHFLHNLVTITHRLLINMIFFRGNFACGGDDCIGATIDTVQCIGDSPRNCVYKDWQMWTPCSDTSCGGSGTKTRNRNPG